MLLMAVGAFTKIKLIRYKSQPPTQGHQEMSCHWDGGDSPGGTRHSMPLVRRQGSFNLGNQLISPPRGDGGARAITA